MRSVSYRIGRDDDCFLELVWHITRETSFSALSGYHVSRRRRRRRRRRSVSSPGQSATGGEDHAAEQKGEESTSKEGGGGGHAHRRPRLAQNQPNIWEQVAPKI